MSTVIFTIVNLGVVVIARKTITRKIESESLKIQDNINTAATKLAFDYKVLQNKIEKVDCNTKNENIKKAVSGEISKEVAKLAFTPIIYRNL